MSSTPCASTSTLIHEKPAHRWATEQLAAEVGLLRSAFAERFIAGLGERPMRYLVRRKLALAATLLRESSLPIARIAYDIRLRIGGRVQSRVPAGIRCAAGDVEAKLKRFFSLRDEFRPPLYLSLSSADKPHGGKRVAVRVFRK